MTEHTSFGGNSDPTAQGDHAWGRPQTDREAAAQWADVVPAGEPTSAETADLLPAIEVVNDAGLYLEWAKKRGPVPNDGSGHLTGIPYVGVPAPRAVERRDRHRDGGAPTRDIPHFRA